MRAAFPLLMTLLAVFMATLVISQCTADGAVTVHVYNNTGAIPDARVMIFDENKNQRLWYDYKTDSSGIASFELPASNYTIFVVNGQDRKPYFFLFQQHVEVLDDSEVQLDFNIQDISWASLTVDAYLYTGDSMEWVELDLVVMDITDKYGYHPVACKIADGADIPANIVVTPATYGIFISHREIRYSCAGGVCKASYHHYALYNISTISEDTTVTFAPSLDQLSNFTGVFHPAKNEQVCEGEHAYIKLVPLELYSFYTPAMLSGHHDADLCRTYMLVNPAVWFVKLLAPRTIVGHTYYEMEFLSSPTPKIDMSPAGTIKILEWGGNLSAYIATDKESYNPGEKILFLWDIADEFGNMLTELEIDGSDVKYADFTLYYPNGSVAYTDSLKLSKTYRAFSYILPDDAPTGVYKATITLDTGSRDGVLYDEARFAVGVVECKISLSPGWNLISLPVDATYSVDDLFGDLGITEAVTWNSTTKSYVYVDELKPGIGYWVYASAEGTVTVTGPLLQSLTLDLSPAGWHLIGAPTSTGEVTEVVPPKALYPAVFGWTGEDYIEQTKMQPGKGYWVLAYQPCTITVQII